MYAHNFSEKVSLRSLEQHSPPARIDSSQRVFFSSSSSSGFPLLCIPLSLTTVSIKKRKAGGDAHSS